MTKVFTDMIGRLVEIPYPPRRIISLVPSQTELLFDLGLDQEVIGITKFCVHPGEWFRNKTRVGGTKTVNIELVKTLSPDLIIANKEENTKEQIEELATMFPVWVSDIHTVDESLTMINEVGILVGRNAEAETLLTDIRQKFTHLSTLHNDLNTRKRVVYFIWRNPWMGAGGDTFINDLIGRAGWINVLADQARYPEITLEEISAKKAGTILLSSEPYPFSDQHIAEIKLALPEADVLLVDGEMFSWYGSRMRLAAAYLQRIAGRGA